MTSDAAVRIAVPGDVPALKALWHTVFGDSGADIDHFFDVYFSPERTAVIGGTGAPVSAAYILPVGNLVLPQSYTSQIGGSQFEPVHNAVRRYGCAMLYAIATHPEYRGRGYGEAVTRVAGILALKSGFPAVVLKPASDSLFEFYAKRTAFREYFEICHLEFHGDDLPEPAHRLTADPVLPGEYRALRKTFLDGTGYIDMDERTLSYQGGLSASAGGGLIRLVAGQHDEGCAVVEPDGIVVRIKELLLGDCLPQDAVAAIAARFPAETYEVRMPRRRDDQQCTKQRFGMLLPAGELEKVASLHSVTWYGPAFD